MSMQYKEKSLKGEKANDSIWMSSCAIEQLWSSEHEDADSRTIWLHKLPKFQAISLYVLGIT